MNSILLFLKDIGTAQLLSDWLQTSYQILTTRESEGLSQPFELCILDNTTLEKYSDLIKIRKEGNWSIFILVTSESQLNSMSEKVLGNIDEIIKAPISKAETLIRVKNLIKTSSTLNELQHLERSLLREEVLVVKMQKDRNEAVAAHEQITNMLDRINDGFIAVDKNWICTYANSAFLKLLNHKKKENIVGKHVWTEFPEIVGTAIYNLSLEVSKTQKPACLENYFEPWDRWFESRIYPSPSGLSIYFTDTTEKRHTEEKLKNKQFQLAEAQRLTHLGSWDVDFITGKSIWSDEFYRILGVSPQTFDATTSSFLKLIHPDDLDKVQQWIDNTVSGNNPGAIEHRIIRPDGSVRFIHSKGQIVFTEQGKPIRMIGTGQDITESKLAEEELKYKNYLQSKSQQLAHLGSWDMDLKSNEAYWSDELYRILNISKEALKPKVEAFLDFVHPEDRTMVKESIQAIFAGEKTDAFEFRIITKDGILQWIRSTGEITSFENGKPVRAVGFIQDITITRKAAEAIRQNEERLRYFLEGFKGITYQSNNKLNMLFGQVEQITGYSTESFLLDKITWDQCIYPPDRERYESAKKSLAKTHYSVDLQYRIGNRDGSHRWFREIAWCSPSVQSLRPVVNGIVIDIDEQKQLEEKVLKLNRIYAVLSQINQMIVRIRDQKELLKKACQIATEHGSFQNAWIATLDQKQDITIVAHNELSQLDQYALTDSLSRYRSFDFEACYNMVREGSPLIVNNPQADEYKQNSWLRFISKGCDSFAILPLMNKKEIRGIFFLCAKEPHFFDENEIKLVKEIALDIGYAMEFLDAQIHRQEIESKLQQNMVEVARKNRELRRTNSALNNANIELRQFDKAKTEFVSVASHEIRTPLASILGFTETLLAPDLHISEQEQKEFLKIIESEARRLSRLVNDILDISRMETGRLELKKETFSIFDLVKTVIRTSATPENLSIEYEVSNDSDATVFGDRERLGQVLRNIIDNAVRFSKPDTSITISIGKSGDFAIVGVKDTGPGLPPEEQKKIFEKFYRVRGETSRSKGSGLGLAIAKEIILAHNGDIWVESEPGKGATFFISIPAKP